MSRSLAPGPRRPGPEALGSLVAWSVLWCVLLSGIAEAQLFSRVYVSGLSKPLAFVQDPSDPTVQYVVEQAGKIKVVRNGVLQSTLFLDLTAQIASGGERGMLGLAFPPDYSASGRFYVNFTNVAGHTVVARFKRSVANPLVADAGSRFDLRWPDGNRFITQPGSNHNGGNMAFGPDGFLYIGMGDGGGDATDHHRSQDPSSLHGKMLRIDVGVGDLDAVGYQIPFDNPYVDNDPVPALDEIWAFGLRNPWRWSFDDPALGGTGALIIGDVGENDWEEIDYQPPGRGARNYGWRNREGSHNFITTIPPAYAPLVDPIFQYSHSVGASINGGYVYRGSALGRSFYRRYFYADFTGRVWSLALTVGDSGEATASNVTEHTSALGGSAALGLISSFGRDARGELYLVGFSKGVVYRILNQHPENPQLALDTPTAGTTVVQPFVIQGWAIDAGAIPGSGTGVASIRVQAFPDPGSGQPAITLPAPVYGIPHPPIAAIYGSDFLNSVYWLSVTGLAPGRYQLVVSMFSTVTNTFNKSKSVTVTVSAPGTNPRMAIESPVTNATVGTTFTISGWAVDLGAPSGTGVDLVALYSLPAAGGAATSLGLATYGGARSDIGTQFGSRFTNSGYTKNVTLPAGTYVLVVYARSTLSGVWTARTVNVTVATGQSGPPVSDVRIAIESPAAGAAVGATFTISGWAIDLGAPSGTGVDLVALYRMPPSGGAATLIGLATYGIPMSNIGSQFGARFTSSGYSASVTLPGGGHTMIVFAHSTLTGIWTSRTVTVTVN